MTTGERVPRGTRSGFPLDCRLGVNVQRHECMYMSYNTGSHIAAVPPRRGPVFVFTFYVHTLVRLT